MWCNGNSRCPKWIQQNFPCYYYCFFFAYPLFFIANLLVSRWFRGSFLLYPFCFSWKLYNFFRHLLTCISPKIWKICGYMCCIQCVFLKNTKRFPNFTFGIWWGALAHGTRFQNLPVQTWQTEFPFLSMPIHTRIWYNISEFACADMKCHFVYSCTHKQTNNNPFYSVLNLLNILSSFSYMNSLPFISFFSLSL